MLLAKRHYFTTICLTFLLITSSIATQSLISSSLDNSLQASNTQGVDFPNYPQAGNPPQNLTGIPIDVNIVFAGFPANAIDTSVIYAELPTTYTTINRMINAEVYKMIKYASFNINYHFYGFDTAWQNFANKFAKFIEDNHEVDYAPYWLQEGLQYDSITTSPVEKCWYVSAREAEYWIKNNAPPGAFDTGYTILFIDTWDTDPRIEEYYFYDGSVPSIPLPIDPECRNSQFMIAYGGYYRFLFIDLLAGPTNYRDLMSIKPLWLYNLPSEKEELSSEIGKLVAKTVELRFVPSYLYAPTFRPSYYINVTIFNKDPTLPILFDMNRVLQEYRDLQPLSSFDGQFNVVNIQSDVNLYQVAEAATDVNGMTDAYQVAEYFLANLDKYVGSHGSDCVLPVFILGGYDLGGLLGMSYSDGKGNPAFVIECLNRRMGGFDLISKAWGLISEPYYIGPGWSVWFIDPVYLDRNMGLEFDFYLLSGSVSVYIADVYNFNKWQDSGYNFGAVSFHQIWSLTPGSYPLLFIPPDPGGKYYIIIRNTGYSTAAFYGMVITHRIEGYTLAPLTIHEVGHSFGLPHPHDGFSWKLYQQGLPVEWPGEYVYWLWDFSDTPMTYAACNVRFDQLDRDILYRGYTATLLNETFSLLKSTEDTLNEKGFSSVPSGISNNVTNSISKINEAIALFSSSSPDYIGSTERAMDAYEYALGAYNAALQASPPMPLSTILIIATVGGIGVVAVAAIILIRRRRAPPIPPPPPPPPPPAV